MTISKGIRPRQESKERWPAAWEKELIDLLEGGKVQSYGDLAHKINEKFPKAKLTRNAVLGKTARLGMADRLARKPPKPKKVKGASPERKQPKRNTVVHRVRLKDRVTEQMAEAEPMSDFQRNSAFSATAWGKPTVSIEKLKDGQCKWPFDCDDGSPVRYCGDTSLDGGVYCFHHTRVSLPPAGERRAIANYRPRYR